MLDAPRALRRERVEQRNRDRGETFSMVVPEPIFELASDMWEAPDAAECSGRDVRFIDTSGQEPVQEIAAGDAGPWDLGDDRFKRPGGGR